MTKNSGLNLVDRDYLTSLVGLPFFPPHLKLVLKTPDRESQFGHPDSPRGEPREGEPAPAASEGGGGTAARAASSRRWKMAGGGCLRGGGTPGVTTCQPILWLGGDNGIPEDQPLWD